MAGESRSAGSGTPMAEKLETWYKKVSADVGRGGLGNGGHRIGFYREIDGDNIRDTYTFPKGEFTVGPFDGNFFWWDYTPVGEKA